MIEQNYIELQVTTYFSFLCGASSCEELFVQAAMLGISALGITDRNSLAGIVRAHEAAKVTGTRLIVGCRLDLEDFSSILVYPTNRVSYGHLCRLLTIGKGRAGKGKCALTFKDVEQWCEGLIGILVTDKPHETLAEDLGKFCNAFGDRAYCGLTRRFRPKDAAFMEAIAQAARKARVPTVVTGDILYHVPQRRILQDVVTCIRLKITIDKAAFYFRSGSRCVDRQRRGRGPKEGSHGRRGFARLAARHGSRARGRFRLDYRGR
jgi:error-prone DNA polymerase